MIALDDIPDDADGEVLRRMRANGDSLTQSRAIDFSVIFPTESAARAFCEAFAEYDVKFAYQESDAEEDRPWDVTVTRTMVPDHAGIIAMEDWLESHAGPLDGLNDGWGCFNINDLHQG
jgi:hypothetical protein